MAARFLDMALDDVAKSRAAENRSPGPRRGGARGAGGPTGRDSPSRSNRSSPYNVNRPSATLKSDSWLLWIVLHCHGDGNTRLDALPL